MKNPQKKVFIGVDLDPYFKKTLIKTTKQWQDLPIRWHKEEGLHVALLSIGWVGENDIVDISLFMESVTTNMEGFDIDFEKITFVAKNPDKNDMRDTQVVRLEGYKSKELKKLYQKLKKALKIPAPRKKVFKPYIELGRIRAQKWQELPSYPVQSLPFPVVMDVSAITLFENINEDGVWRIIPMEVFDLQ